MEKLDKFVGKIQINYCPKKIILESKQGLLIVQDLVCLVVIKMKMSIYLVLFYVHRVRTLNGFYKFLIYFILLKFIYKGKILRL